MPLMSLTLTLNITHAPPPLRKPLTAFRTLLRTLYRARASQRALLLTGSYVFSKANNATKTFFFFSKTFSTTSLITKIYYTPSCVPGTTLLLTTKGSTGSHLTVSIIVLPSPPKKKKITPLHSLRVNHQKAHPLLPVNLRVRVRARVI